MKQLIISLLSFLAICGNAQQIDKLQLDQIISSDGMYIDQHENVYATEGWDGDKIYKIAPDGEVSVFATGLHGPIDILMGRDGSFLVSEWNAPQISRVSPTGEVSKYATVRAGAGPMTQDHLGNLYVTHNVNDGSGYISKITPQGEVSLIAEGGKIINPGGIDIDSRGDLYVSNFNNANIVKISTNGAQEVIAKVPGDKQWRTGHLKIVDDAIIVTGLMDHRIYRVSLDGDVTVLAGTGEPGNEVGDATSTRLSNPNGLYYDEQNGVLYFSTAFSKSGFIQKINLDERSVYRSEYYAGIVFRETPYADIRGARPLPRERAEGVNHFQFDYDHLGRLVRVRYLLNDDLKPFSDRFVRAPHIEIGYTDDMEIRTFYSALGHRTVVSGDVYEVRIGLDENGDRTSLEFFDVNGDRVENDFRIASYEWDTDQDGSVIERRYDGNGDLQRNRPGFGYFITKFDYDHRGLLRVMTNLGKGGNEVTPDEAGIAHTQIGYDRNTFFVQWLNLDENGMSKRGMSNIAEIRYTPAPLYEHATATFIDADGSPQTTNWGAHIVKYTHDKYGNATSRRFFGLDKTPTNVTNGVGWIKMTYSDDGFHELARHFFNKDGEPVEISGSNIHAIETTLDQENRLSSRSSYNLEGQLVVDPSVGYATEVWTYDNRGRHIVRAFLDASGDLTDHATWQIAQMIYTYDDHDGLTSVRYLDASGVETQAIWNPRH